jgi:TRAP-type C4-dicarboxylate transport system substrate-binding protein
MRNGYLGKKGLILGGVILFPLLLIGFTICKAAEPPKVKAIKWAMFMPEADYNVQTQKRFRDDIEAYTHGAVKPKLYYAGQIAETKDLPGLCKSGAVEMITTAPLQYPSMFPLSTLLQMIQLVYKTPEQAAYTWRGLLRDIPEIQGEYAKQNQYCLNRAALSTYYTLSKKPIRSLADLKGVKIRALPGKHASELMRSLGATPIMFPPAEIYESLMRGVLDAVMMPIQTFESLRFYEAAKYIGLPYGAPPGFYQGINLDLWNSFTPEIKKAFTQAATEYGARDLEAQVSTESKSIESLKKKGVQFIEFDKKDMEILITKTGDPWVAAKDYATNELKVDAAVADRMVKRWRELTDEYNQRYLSTGKKWEYK